MAPDDTGRAPLPLIVELHGRGVPPLGFDRWTGLSAAAVSQGIVVAMPAALDEIWNDGRWAGTPRDAVDDVGFLDRLIVDVESRLPIATDRIAIVGMSNGAAMTGRYACARADRLAAVAQVAGTAGESVVEACRPARPIPIIQIHGDADRLAPYRGGRPETIGARLLLQARGGAAPNLGVEAWARHWVEANAASPTPIVDRLGPDVTMRRWSGVTPRSDVVFVRVEGGGHTWPGARGWAVPWLGRVSRTIDATDLILAFVLGHRLPGFEASPPG